PGAWALILSSPLVRLQMRLLAQGSARQFLNSGIMGDLLVPDLPREDREIWDRLLSVYQQRRIAAEAAWRELLGEASRPFERTHREAGLHIPMPAISSKG